MNSKRFIPNLYIEDIISKLAQEETGKRQYYRPVYSLHKWWARRPGALFRSIILLATRPELASTLFESNSGGALSERSQYFHNHDIADVIILDPFMGGGTTLAEANRLGAKVIGCDINPVAFWIVRETLKPIDLEKLEHYFHELERKAGERIKALYSTICVRCKTQCDGLYAFWVRYVNCPHCGKEVHLFKRTLLNEGISRNRAVSVTNPAVVFCPNCFALNDWHGKSNTTCRQCNADFDPQAGTYDEGFFVCPHCKQEKVALLQTMRAGQRLQEKLVAIEYWCSRCKDRLYKAPDEKDTKKLSDIKRKFERMEDWLFIPKQRIAEGSSSVRWRQHNYRCYYEVFHPRQLLAFTYLLSAIQEIPEEEYRNAFITAFSNSLEYNNMMTPYNYPHRKLHHLFNYHAMPLTTTPVENAVWGVSDEGAGTFVNCYKRYVNAKRYCQTPFDKFKNSRGEIHTVYAPEEKIAAHFVSTFEELKQTPRGALLFCGDSSHLPAVPDKSVDFVITDPPYFDNVHYSELSNFFYVWLSMLNKQHPYFRADHVPTEKEAIVNEGMDKDEEDYQHLLTAVLRECGRVLKDEGRLIFTFHHTKWRAWWTVLSAIAESGFRVADSFPVMSEYKVNPHVRNKQALDMDLVLVCQKRSIPFEPLPLSLSEAVQRAMDGLPVETSNGSKNRVFLRFMGELLKEASAVWDTQTVTYEWFSEALTHFDDIIAQHIQVAPENQVNETHTTEQLRLF
jgi:adenine-specific DNA methylase